MPLAKPPVRNLEDIALSSGELSNRFRARTERRALRNRDYNRFRLVGSLVIIMLMTLGLYASLSAPDASTPTADAPASTQQVTPSASSISTTPVAPLFN